MVVALSFLEKTMRKFDLSVTRLKVGVLTSVK